MLDLWNDQVEMQYTLCVICSKKGSGKTTLLLKLLLDPGAYKGKYDRIIIISSTFEAQYAKVWSKLDPTGIQVESEVTDELLKEILQYQKEHQDKNLLVVSDDQGENWRTLNSKLVSFFVSNSRHARISMIFLTQCFTQISPPIRSQADIVISFSSVSFTELVALCRVVSIMSMTRFRRMFFDVTQEPYSFLVMTSKPTIDYYHNFDFKIDIEKYDPKT